jgi:hypothetical protein
MTDGFLVNQGNPGVLSQIGTRLSRAAAGARGNLAQFDATRQAQAQQLSQQRQQAAAQDLLRAKELLAAGNLDGFMRLANERTRLIQQLGGDPSDTVRMAGLAQAAKLGHSDSLAMLNSEIDAGLSAAIGAGVIEDPALAGQKIGLQRETLDQRRAELAQRQAEEEEDIRQFGERERRAGQELQLKRDVEARQAGKMSAASEKRLIEVQGNIVNLARDANRFDNLAGDLLQAAPTGGVVGRFDEWLKETLGTEDDVSDLRRS